MRKLEIGHSRIDDTWETLSINSGSHVDYTCKWGSEPLPFPANTFDLVYASHVLEHIPWTHTVDALAEILRILAPRGRFEVWVPNAKKILQAWQDNAPERDGWFRFNPERDVDIWLNGRIFTYGPEEDNFHRALFTPRLLDKQLRKAGFVDILPLHKPRAEDHGFINLGRSAIKPKGAHRGSRKSKKKAGR